MSIYFSPNVICCPSTALHVQRMKPTWTMFTLHSFIECLVSPCCSLPRCFALTALYENGDLQTHLLLLPAECDWKPIILPVTGANGKISTAVSSSTGTRKDKVPGTPWLTAVQVVLWWEIQATWARPRLRLQDASMWCGTKTGCKQSNLQLTPAKQQN